MDILILIAVLIVLWAILRLTYPSAPIGPVIAKPEYPVLVHLTVYKSGKEDVDEGWTFWKEFTLPTPPVTGLFIEDFHRLEIIRVEVETLDRIKLHAYAKSRVSPRIDEDDVLNQLAMALDNGWKASSTMPDGVDEWREKNLNSSDGNDK